MDIELIKIVQKYHILKDEPTSNELSVHGLNMKQAFQLIDECVNYKTKELQELLLLEKKHVDYAEKVSYECSKKNAQLIGKMTELTEQLLDVKSQLEISQQKVKLNYDSAIDFESKLAERDKEIIELKKRIHYLEFST